MISTNDDNCELARAAQGGRAGILMGPARIGFLDVQMNMPSSAGMLATGGVPCAGSGNRQNI